MEKILLVGLGGFLGAVTRYGFANLVRRYFETPFPVATLSINGLGSLLIGIILQASQFQSFNLFAAVGFLGAFTTFSAFSYETIELIKKQELALAAAYIFASVALCLLGVTLGSWLGRSHAPLP